MKRIVLVLLVVMASGVFAQSPPPQFKRTDSGLVAVQASVPVFLHVNGHILYIDSAAVVMSSDSVRIGAGAVFIDGSDSTVLNGVYMWTASGTDGQIPKLQSGKLVFQNDLTGDPLLDTVNATNLQYRNPAGDTVIGFTWSDGDGVFMYEGGRSTGSSRFYAGRVSADSAHITNGIRALRLHANQVRGIPGLAMSILAASGTALNISAGSGQPINLQNGISGDINFYYGALLYMALDNGMLDGQSRSAIINFLHGVFEDSLIVEGGTGTGYVASDTVNARVVLGIGGDYVSSWAEIGASTNADSVDHVPADMGGISTGNIVYYDGTSITHTSFDVSDSSVAFADSAGAVTHESVQDIIGAMVTGNTETGITVTYQDGDGTLDFVVTGGGGGIFAWAGVDTLAVLIDSTGDTILAVARPAAGKTVIHAEDGDEIIVGDTTAYARAPHGVIAAQITIGVPADTANSDSSAATIGHVSRALVDSVELWPRIIEALPYANPDSVYLFDWVKHNDTTVMFIDSTVQGNDTSRVVVVWNLERDVHVDSLTFTYKTNGAIDTIRVMGPVNGGELADSVYQAFSTGWNSTTRERLAFDIDADLLRGQQMSVVIVSVLADDNDRTVGYKASLKGTE